MVRWAIENPAAQGAYNATGSAPVTNAEFMRALRAALGRPWCPPTPVWAVKLGARFVMGVDSSLALGGRRCVPRRLLEEGFVLQHTDLDATLRDLLK
jgi:NAD dependent epimerase/dehydratase family enzyme